jgi:hypothetical protein
MKLKIVVLVVASLPAFTACHQQVASTRPNMAGLVSVGVETVVSLREDIATAMRGEADGALKTYYLRDESPSPSPLQQAIREDRRRGRPTTSYWVEFAGQPLAPRQPGMQDEIRVSRITRVVRCNGQPLDLAGKC